MAFTAVGTQADTSSTTQQGTISVTTTNLGDLVVMFIVLASPTIFVTGMTGGECGTWTQAGTAISNANVTLQTWYGKVATVGTAAATLTFSASIGSVTRISSYQKFSAGLGSTTPWSVDTSGALSNTASTAITYPTLAPSGSSELYVGFCHSSAVATSGATAGYTYQHPTSSFELLAYNLAVSAASAPTATQASSGISVTRSALFSVSKPSTGWFQMFE